MKTPVSNETVMEYVRRLRAGEPLGELFPGPLSECALSEPQRKAIREARKVRAALHKKVKVGESNGVASALTNVSSKSEVLIKDRKAPTKLRKLLYLQLGRCFFCGEEVPESQASIEHLVAKKWGGKGDEWNEVVCHSSLNGTFGGMDLRSKFEFVIKAAGRFRCP